MSLSLSQKSPDAWNELNRRQQTYLRLIYTADQDAEKGEQQRWKRGQRRRPADEWRWLLYADLPFGHTYLKSLLTSAEVVDEGTGSTFTALEKRGLILCQHQFEEGIISFEPLLSVRLTTQGRKVARTGLGERAPKKLPTGTLREWHWQALAKLYAAGEAGLFDDGVRSGYYGETSWNTWLRLRDYKAGALMKEVSKWDDNGRYRYGATITESGKQFYKENWQKYRAMYPDVDARLAGGMRRLINATDCLGQAFRLCA